TDFYVPGTEPWEPNVTAHPDPQTIKWKPFLTPGIPVPTPWNKAKFDSLSAINRMEAQKLLPKDSFYGKVGAMEGAGYSSKGLYRPSVDCIMFSKGLESGFDPVCRYAIKKMIDMYTK
ncbi:MAG: peptidase M64, partial [Methanobacteriota archaeon]